MSRWSQHNELTDQINRADTIVCVYQLPLVPRKIRADLTRQDPGGSDVPTHNGTRGRSQHSYRVY